MVTSWWVTTPPVRPKALVVAAPHPDDEVFGAAELMRWAVSLSVRVTVAAVTRGEASHAASRRVRRRDLVTRRARERRAALDVLGIADRVTVVELDHADGAVSTTEERLTGDLAELAGPGTTILVPALADRHPDHQATCRAGRLAARRAEATLWETPIWARVDDARPAPHASVLALTRGGRARKWWAARCFESQLVALGPGPEDGPVLSPREVGAFCGPREWVCT